MVSLISKWCVPNWPTFSISWQWRKSLTNGTNPSAFCKKRLLWKGPEATQIHSSRSSIAFSEVHCKVKKKNEKKKKHKVTSSLIFGFSIISFYLFFFLKKTNKTIYLFIYLRCMFVCVHRCICGGQRTTWGGICSLLSLPGTEGLNSGHRACHCTPASTAERLHWPLLCHYTGELR